MVLVFWAPLLAIIAQAERWKGSSLGARAVAEVRTRATVGAVLEAEELRRSAALELSGLSTGLGAGLDSGSEANSSTGAAATGRAYGNAAYDPGAKKGTGAMARVESGEGRGRRAG